MEKEFLKADQSTNEANRLQSQEAPPEDLCSAGEINDRSRGNPWGTAGPGKSGPSKRVGRISVAAGKPATRSRKKPTTKKTKKFFVKKSPH